MMLNAMRTTVALSERAHEIAKRYAAAHQLTLGEAISRLLEGEADSAAGPVIADGPNGLLVVSGTGRRFGVEIRRLG